MITISLPQYHRELKLNEGETLLELLQRQGFYLASDCAGAGTCGKCKIRLLDFQPQAEESERQYLTAAELGNGIRLACQIQPQKDCQLEFLVQLDFAGDQILTEGQRQAIHIDSPVKSCCVQVVKPELAFDRFDWESVAQALPKDAAGRQVSVSFLQRLPEVLRQGDYQINLIYNESHYLDITPGGTPPPLYGVAIDCGTTTLVAKLIDLCTGVVQAVASGLNPQQQVGADVISRIGYTQKHKPARRRLQQMVVDALNEMIGTVTTTSGVAPQQIVDVVVVGNTVMGHLFLALDATYLAQSPYTPTVQFYPEVTAAELGLAVQPLADVRLLPNIGRFVGSDTTAVILAAGMDQSDKITLAIDIGTNGEIVLGNRHKLLATSTAAGPAFEGARLRFGMRATAGAIERVEIRNDELMLRTIGNIEPRGICGSGIICLIGELLRTRLISETGQLLLENHSSESDEKEIRRIGSRVQVRDQERIFLLHQNDEDSVYLTQRDIREIQLAKSAIRTGINILLREYGVTIEEVDRILLAGAFGNFLDRAQAIRLGLLPAVKLEKIRFIGNAACAGAELALLSGEMRRRAAAIASMTRYVEIATHPQFQDQFMENMIFPTGD